MKKYPGIELHITEEISSVLEYMVLQGKLDFCIFSLPIASPNIAYEPLFEEEVLFAVPPEHPVNRVFLPSKRQHKVDLSLFAKDSFILIKEGQRLRTLAMEWFNQIGFSPNIIFETRSTETAHAFIAGGMGVGFVPDAVRKLTPQKSRAVYYGLQGIDTRRQFVAGYHRSAFLSAAAKAFIVFAKQGSKEM